MINHDYPPVVEPYEVVQGVSDLNNQYKTSLPVDHTVLGSTKEEESSEEPHLDTNRETHAWYGGNTAAKFLLAGGIAGAGSCASAKIPSIDQDLANSPSHRCEM